MANALPPIGARVSVDYTRRLFRGEAREHHFGKVLRHGATGETLEVELENTVQERVWVTKSSVIEVGKRPAITTVLRHAEVTGIVEGWPEGHPDTEYGKVVEQLAIYRLLERVRVMGHWHYRITQRGRETLHSGGDL